MSDNTKDLNCNCQPCGCDPCTCASNDLVGPLGHCGCGSKD